jgi:hypothetical protein
MKRLAGVLMTMIKTAVLTMVAVVCVCGLGSIAGTETKRPPAREVPAPNAAAPVDYFSWLNRGNSQNRDNAFDAYLAAYK